VTYDTNGTTITISLLESTVTNSMGRDDNSLVLAVKEKTATTYQDQVESGAVLTSGVAVSVPLPTNFTIQMGDTLRVTTTFGEGAGLDPTAPCYIKF
jgi:hypothetical protein